MGNRDIIVIGGSSGATAPLRGILSSLSADLPAAVFVVLHIPAQGTGLFSRLASAASRLPVLQAQSGMAIKNGHIYLAAPDHHLLVYESQIMLGRGPPENMARPACGGVLSELQISHPLRFRCQAGHAYTADALAKEQEGRVDEALRVALRIIEERPELVHRMAEDGRQNGRVAVARMHDARATAYREYADMIRRVMLKSFYSGRPKQHG
jgi:chemotaxis response regulator CheB